MNSFKSNKMFYLIILIIISFLISFIFHNRYNIFNYYEVTIVPNDKKLELKKYFNGNFNPENFKDFLEKNNMYENYTKYNLDYTISAIEQKHPESFFIKNNLFIHKLYTEGTQDKLVLYLAQRKSISNDLIQILIRVIKTRIDKLYINCTKALEKDEILLNTLISEEIIYKNFLNKYKNKFIYNIIKDDPEIIPIVNQMLEDPLFKIENLKNIKLKNKYPSLISFLSIFNKKNSNSENIITNLNNAQFEINKSIQCVSNDMIDISYKKDIIHRINFVTFFIFVSAIIFFLYFNFLLFFVRKSK